MKYGDTFVQRSTPKWGAYNVDYNEIKKFIKTRTTKGQVQAVSIPGRQNGHDTLETFENELFLELADQHRRIDLFVHSKSGEIARRLKDLNKQVVQLGRHRPNAAQKRISVRRVEKYSKTEEEVLKVGEEIQLLARFVGAQRLAFQKLLKKYKKWTGSSSLGSRFQKEVLSPTHGFWRKDFTPLLSQWNDVLTAVRAPFDAGLTWTLGTTDEMGRELDRSAPLADEPVPTEARLETTVNACVANPTAAILHNVYKDGTDADVDSTLATLPFGRSAGKAVYWIHSDNIVQIHILLLQYLRLRRSTGIDASSKSSRRSSIHESAVGYTATTGSETGIIICDELQAFAKRRSSITIGDMETSPGASAEEAAASIRYSSSGEALITVGTGHLRKPQIPNLAVREGPKKAVLKSKALKSLFNSKVPITAPQTRSPGINYEDQQYFRDLTSKPACDNVREWLQAHHNVQPLVRLQYKRSRFADLSNNEAWGIWATLDKDVSMRKSSVEDLDSLISSFNSDYTTTSDLFPHAILEVRWEGKSRPDLIKALDVTHLAERVRGFSLETHAIATLCKPVGMPTPFWLSALEIDIRKVPSNVPTSRRHSESIRLSPECGNTRHTSASAASATDGPSGSSSSPLPGSSATSVSNQLEAPSLKTFKKKRRNRRERPLRGHLGAVENSQQRYWNEFDDDEEGMEHETYTIFVDPESSVTFPGAHAISEALRAIKSKVTFSFEKTWLWLRPQSNRGLFNEQQTLISNQSDEQPSVESFNANSSNSGVTSRHLHHRLYSTFPQSLFPENSMSAGQASQDRDNLLLELFVGSFLASIVLLSVTVHLLSTNLDSKVHSPERLEFLGPFMAILLSIAFAAVGTGATFFMRNVQYVRPELICIIFALVVFVNGYMGLILSGSETLPW